MDWHYTELHRGAMLAIQLFSQPFFFFFSFLPSSFKMVLVSVEFGKWQKNKTKRRTKNLQKQVWLHRICQIASLSLESFPQWASGKLSENHLVADANEPLWTPFPVCRCLWLSINFKMFKVEQIAQPVSFCWLNSAVDEEFLLFSKT